MKRKFLFDLIALQQSVKRYQCIIFFSLRLFSTRIRNRPIRFLRTDISGEKEDAVMYTPLQKLSCKDLSSYFPSALFTMQKFHNFDRATPSKIGMPAHHSLEILSETSHFNQQLSSCPTFLWLSSYYLVAQRQRCLHPQPYKFVLILM